MRPLRYLNGRTPSPVPAEAGHKEICAAVSLPSFPPKSRLVEKPLATPTSAISRREFGRTGIAAAVTLSSSSLLGCNTVSVDKSKPADKTSDNGGSLTPDQTQEVE